MRDGTAVSRALIQAGVRHDAITVVKPHTDGLDRAEPVLRNMRDIFDAQLHSQLKMYGDVAR